ncbi:MAG: glycosyltransferase [Candidatus Scatovivens sp.]
MNVEIICPLYNAEKYIINLNKSLIEQENVEIKKITYILTESEDRTQQILNQNNFNYYLVKKEEFSHSLSREKIAMKSEADILVFITQDVLIEDNLWLNKLIDPILKGEVEACYSKQISKYNNIEKYTREKNYPEDSFIVTKDDVKEKGLKTFFFSDASSAIKKDIFVQLNGYDKKDFPTNEDMYIAYKLIMNGYRIKYCADSVVYHSHNFTLKQLYRRYYNTGKFFVMVSELNKFNQEKAGGGLAKYILIRAIKEKNWKVLLRFVPDMIVRYIGMKKGKIDGKQ